MSFAAIGGSVVAEEVRKERTKGPSFTRQRKIVFDEHYSILFFSNERVYMLYRPIPQTR